MPKTCAYYKRGRVALEVEAMSLKTKDLHSGMWECISSCSLCPLSQATLQRKKVLLLQVVEMAGWGAETGFFALDQNKVSRSKGRTLLLLAPLTALYCRRIGAGCRLQGHLFVPARPGLRCPASPPEAGSSCIGSFTCRACVWLCLRAATTARTYWEDRGKPRWGGQMPEPGAGGEPPPGPPRWLRLPFLLTRMEFGGDGSGELQTDI